MSKYVAAVSLGVLVVALSAASCKRSKDEVPPMPSAPPVVSTPPPPVDLVAEEDAGADAGDADAAKKATGPYDPNRLLACCNALAQNAKSAPPMQQPFMLQAAGACKAAAQNGNIAGVTAALRQAGLPGCK